MKFSNYFKQLSTKQCDFWEKTEMKKVVLVATMAAFGILGMPAEAEATLKAGSALEKPTQSAPQEESPAGAWMEEAEGQKELEYDPEAFEPASAGGDKLNLDLRQVPADRRTPALCLEAVRESAWNLQQVPDGSMTEEICLEAVRQDGGQLEHVPARFRTKEVCMAAVRQDGAALEFVPDALKTPETCMLAVQSMPGALTFVPERLKTPEMCAEALAGAAPSYRDELLRHVPARMQAEVLRRAGMLTTRRDGEAQTLPAEQDQVRHGAGVLLPNR